MYFANVAHYSGSTFADAPPRRRRRIRPQKSHHEINGVVRRQNAQVTHAGPEGIPGRQRHARRQENSRCVIMQPLALSPCRRNRRCTQDQRAGMAQSRVRRFPLPLPSAAPRPDRCWPALPSQRWSSRLRLPARPGEALSCRHMPYSVISTLAPECFSNLPLLLGLQLYRAARAFRRHEISRTPK